jgi:hypothetical protein
MVWGRLSHGRWGKELFQSEEIIILERTTGEFETRAEYG